MSLPSMLADFGTYYIPPHFLGHASIATLLATIAIGIIILGHFTEHFQRASRVIHASSRRGGKRKRQIALFFFLALFCFFWISVARFARNGVPDYGVVKARAEIAVEEARLRAAQKVEEGKAKLAQGYEEGKEKLAQGFEEGRRGLKEAVRNPVEAWEGVKDGVRDGVKGAREGVEAQAEALRGKAGEWKELAWEKAEEFQEAAGEKSEALTEGGVEKLVGEKKSSFGAPTFPSEPVLHSDPGRRYVDSPHGVVPGSSDGLFIINDSPFGDAKTQLPLSAWLDRRWPIWPPFNGPDEARDWVDKWHQPSHYWWVEQWYMGALAWAPYLGWQTRVRDLPWSTPLIFIFLSTHFSMAGAQSLLYALLLFSPVRDADMERWTPGSALWLVPTWVFVGVNLLMPAAVGWEGMVYVHRSVEYAAYVLGFAVAWINPRHLGRYHITAHDARETRTRIYFLNALPILLLHMYASLHVVANTGYSSHSRWWLFGSDHWLWNSNKVQETAEPLQQAASMAFGALAKPAAINSMCWDVVLSGVIMATWAIVHNLDARSMLRSTLIPWIPESDDPTAYLEEEGIRRLHSVNDTQARANWLNAVRNLTRFARPGDAPASGTQESTIRKRGRPPKHTRGGSSNENGYAIHSSSRYGSRSPVRARSGTGRGVSPEKQTLVRTRSKSRTRYDGARREYYSGLAAAGPVDEQSTGWESAGLLWCLGVVGGLGMASVGAFGAEAVRLF